MKNIHISDHEQALTRYMKFPKKKEGDQRAKQEISEDLYIYRRKFHQVRHVDFTSKFQIPSAMYSEIRGTSISRRNDRCPFASQAPGRAP